MNFGVEMYVNANITIHVDTKKSNSSGLVRLENKYIWDQHTLLFLLVSEKIERELRTGCLPINSHTLCTIWGEKKI